jgi:ATP-dependent Lon protease
VKNGMEIVPVSRMEEVIKHALIRQPQPIKWEEDLSVAKAKPTDEEAAGIVAH